MDISTLDLTALFTLWIAAVLLLLPLGAFAARFGLRPVLDAVARVRAAGRAALVAELEARFARVEGQMRDLTAAVRGVAERVERSGEPVSPF
jgi:hypothetical protein